MEKREGCGQRGIAATALAIGGLILLTVATIATSVILQKDRQTQKSRAAEKSNAILSGKVIVAPQPYPYNRITMIVYKVNDGKSSLSNEDRLFDKNLLVDDNIDHTKGFDNIQFELTNSDDERLVEGEKYAFLVFLADDNQQGRVVSASVANNNCSQIVNLLFNVTTTSCVFTAFDTNITIHIPSGNCTPRDNLNASEVCVASSSTGGENENHLSSSPTPTPYKGPCPNTGICMPEGSGCPEGTVEDGGYSCAVNPGEGKKVCCVQTSNCSLSRISNACGKFVEVPTYECGAVRERFFAKPRIRIKSESCNLSVAPGQEVTLRIGVQAHGKPDGEDSNVGFIDWIIIDWGDGRKERVNVKGTDYNQKVRYWTNKVRQAGGDWRPAYSAEEEVVVKHTYDSSGNYTVKIASIHPNTTNSGGAYSWIKGDYLYYNITSTQINVKGRNVSPTPSYLNLTVSNFTAACSGDGDGGIQLSWTNPDLSGVRNPMIVIARAVSNCGRDDCWDRNWKKVRAIGSNEEQTVIDRASNRNQTLLWNIKICEADESYTRCVGRHTRWLGVAWVRGGVAKCFNTVFPTPTPTLTTYIQLISWKGRDIVCENDSNNAENYNITFNFKLRGSLPDSYKDKVLKLYYKTGTVRDNGNIDWSDRWQQIEGGEIALTENLLNDLNSGKLVSLSKNFSISVPKVEPQNDQGNPYNLAYSFKAEIKSGNNVLVSDETDNPKKVREIVSERCTAQLGEHKVEIKFKLQPEGVYRKNTISTETVINNGQPTSVLARKQGNYFVLTLHLDQGTYSFKIRPKLAESFEIQNIEVAGDLSIDKINGQDIIVKLGDVNEDDQIDVADLERVAAGYLSNDANLDIDGSGTVDQIDMDIVARSIEI